MTLAAPLYMLRHGETAWNTERRMQGTKDSALTDRGRAQALAMGRTLRAELAQTPGPTLFLRSPLGRARGTPRNQPVTPSALTPRAVSSGRFAACRRRDPCR